VKPVAFVGHVVSVAVAVALVALLEGSSDCFSLRLFISCLRKTWNVSDKITLTDEVISAHLFAVSAFHNAS